MHSVPCFSEKINDFKPLLSVLVPAYCYAEGLERIIAGLTLFPSQKVEIIIFDDSPNCEIEKIACEYAGQSISTIVYQRNLPPLGAIDNWNALLDAARGDFCLLMHHDEFPIGDNFIRDLINELSCSTDSDVLLIDCLLFNPMNGLYRRHLPMWMRSFVINNFPSFLFRRNVIGPTSALVIPRVLYPRYNNKLRWLVDVDLYFRVFKSPHKLKSLKSIKIGSVLNRSDSITAKLGSEIKGIKRREYSYLNDLYSKSSIWLSLSLNNTLIGVVVLLFESIFWIGFRVIYRSINFLFKCNSVKN